MAVQFYSAIILLSFLWKSVHAIENKVYYSHGGKGTTFREELVITNVTSSDEFVHLGLEALKWKSITVAMNSYAVGLMATGVCIVTPVRNDFNSSIQSNITDNTNKIKDLEVYKKWNSTSAALEAVVVLLLEDDTLQWYTITENLTLASIWHFTLERDVINFKIYSIHSVDHLFVLRKKPGNVGTILEIFKYNLFNARHKPLWLQQTIHFDEVVTSFTLNALAYDHFLSIPNKSLKIVKIYKEINHKFVYHSSIKDTDADNLQSFRIGPNSYLLTNGHNAGIYKMTRHGPIKETINHNHFHEVDHWLIMPVKSFKEEIFLLAQKQIDYDSHSSYKLELIHSNGFDFNAYDEIPCSHFGMEFHGIDCIIEEDAHHISIKSSSILPFKDFIGLIVPHFQQSSRFFHLNTMLKVIPNPRKEKLKLLREQQEKLKAMHEELKKLRESEQTSAPIVQAPQATYRNKNTKEYQQRTTETAAVTAKLRTELEEIEKSLDSLKTKLNDIRSDKQSFGTLIINAPLQIQGISSIGSLLSPKINDKSSEDTLVDIVVRGSKKPILGQKGFTNLEVDNVVFDHINGRGKGELLFKDLPIEIHGSVTVESLIIDGDVSTGKVNNITLENEIVQSEQINTGPIEFETIAITGNLEMENEPKLDYANYFNTNVLENLAIPSNLTVQKINFENFTSIQNQIVMRNIDGPIPNEMTINGVLTITGDTTINYLNDLVFPEQYVFQSSESTEISGKKAFEDDISTTILKSNGLINGVNTSRVVTLSDIQSIPGTVHFSDLSVHDFTSANVEGDDTENFLQNLTLNETTHLKTPASIQHLEVEGCIIVDKINDVNTSIYLDNIVFKDEENVQISSKKIFLTLSSSKVELDTLNSLEFNTFVNKETDQKLNMNILNGNVTFENLYLLGNFGEVNITNTLTNSIKLTEDKNISLLCISEFTADNIHILEKLNNLPVVEYLYSTGDRIMSSVRKIKNVEARNVIVRDNLIAEIDGLNVDELKEKILSTIEDQYIGGDVHITELFVDKLDAETVNNRSLNQVFNSEFYTHILADIISKNKINVKNMNIHGNLITNKVNELNMPDILKSCTFTRESNLQPNIAFRDHVNFKELTVGTFNGVPFAEFMENLVFRNESNVKLADKHFVNGFEVKNYIDTDKLNGILLEDILRDGNERVVRGTLNIDGDVTVDEDLEIETLNGVPVKELQNKVKIDGDTVKINGDLWINNLAYIQNLWTYNFVNGENLNDVLKNVIYLNASAVLENKLTFNEKVVFKKDFEVFTINDIDLTSVSEDIVMINKHNTIVGPVTFQYPVEINNRLFVSEQFESNTIMGINISDWSENAVFINQLVAGKLTFGNVTVAQDIKTDFINNINMSKLVPLRTEQNITEALFIEKLTCFHNVTVDGTVNGIILMSEYTNTVLNHGTQTISSKVNFEDNVVVYNEALLAGMVNGVHFNNIVHLNKNKTMSGKYNFLSKVSVQNVTVDGLVNGLNITKWEETSLKKHLSTQQNISQPIHVKSLILENYSHGNGLISGLDFQNLSDAMEYKRQFKNKVESELATDYSNVCGDVNYLLKIAKKQIYKFKHLDRFNFLQFDEHIELLHPFKHDGGDYLLIREKGSCSTHYYRWHYKDITDHELIDMGEVLQIINVNTNGGLHFITRSDASSNCVIQHSNLWTIESRELRHLHQIQEELILLQESQILNTFYGLSKDFAFEYRIRQSSVYIYRKWPITGDNLAFVPPGLNTGLALRDGEKIIKLMREDIGIEESYYSYNTEELIIGNVQEVNNILMPGRRLGDFVVLNVGKPRTPMVAVISQEHAWVKGRTDSIKIYSDIFDGSLFDKIPTYKPSSLISLELGSNGETLLVFLEDQSVVQIYEYKGIEGFRHRRSVNFEGEAINKVKLPLGVLDQNHDALAIVHKNQVTFLEVVTDGETVDMKDLNCIVV